MYNIALYCTTELFFLLTHAIKNHNKLVLTMSV